MLPDQYISSLAGRQVIRVEARGRPGSRRPRFLEHPPSCACVMRRLRSPLDRVAFFYYTGPGEQPPGHDRLTTTELYLNLSPEDAIREFLAKW